MKTLIKFTLLFLMFFFLACGESKVEKQKPMEQTSQPEQEASEIIDLTSKGVGPIQSVVLDSEIDYDLMNLGKTVYMKYCVSCHRPSVRFVGPALKGVLNRRTPEWVMNMILNPIKMAKEDPLAKQLLKEHRTQMPYHLLSEEETRGLIEYFRVME